MDYQHYKLMNDNEDTTMQLNATESINAAVDNSFFYTQDRFFNTLDVNNVLEYVSNNYPQLTVTSTDQQIKSTILKILSNDEFMVTVLSMFNLTIFDFFKFLNSNYGMVFKGAFLKKVQKEISNHEYSRKYIRATNS